jgi:hypothetical protein
MSGKSFCHDLEQSKSSHLISTANADKQNFVLLTIHQPQDKGKAA